MVSKHPKSSEKASVREVTRFHIPTPKPWVAGSNPPAPAKKKPQALPVVFLRRQEARETKGTAKMVYSCAVTGAIKMKKMPHEL